MPRKEQIKAFVSAEEKAKAEALAAAEGLTISAYLRRCIILAQNPTPKSQKQAA